jgi:exodeoxyribonuclease X
MKLFRVIDFETTGLRPPPQGGIIQVGYTDVVWEGNSLEVGNTFEELCNPGVPIEIGAMAIHHIRQHHIDGKQPPAAILNGLEDGVDFFVAHNAKFERSFYRPTKPWICTLRTARQLYPLAEQYKNQYLRYFLGVEANEERANPPHGAGPDSYVTALILKRMMIDMVKNPSMGKGKNFLDAMNAWSNTAQILEVVSFGKHKGRKWSQVDANYLRWVIANTDDDDVRHTATHYLNG